MLLKKNINNAEACRSVCSVFVSVVWLCPCLSAWFLMFSFRRCVFLQKWKCCIMNGNAVTQHCANLRGSHLSIWHSTHTRNTILRDGNKIRSTCPTWGLQMLPYCLLWNLWIILSSNAVRNSVFCQKRRTELSLISPLNAIFFFLYSMLHHHNSSCPEKESESAQSWLRMLYNLQRVKSIFIFILFTSQHLLSNKTNTQQITHHKKTKYVCRTKH